MLTAGMQSLRLVNRECRTESASLPLPRFPAQHGSSVPRPAASLPRPGPIFLSSLSLALNENPFPSPISRSMFLAYSFRIHRTFTESAPVRRSGMPRQSPLPFGGFYAPPDQGVQLVQLSRSLP